MSAVIYVNGVDQAILGAQPAFTVAVDESEQAVVPEAVQSAIFVPSRGNTVIEDDCEVFFIAGSEGGVVLVEDILAQPLLIENATVTTVPIPQTDVILTAPAPGPQVTSELTWIDYVSQWASQPMQLATIAAGDVWQYTYTDGVLYRLINTATNVDAFYSNFDGSAVTGLVVARAMSIN